MRRSSHCGAFKNLEVEVGFEPTNDGFANRCLRPLGYSTMIGAGGF